MKRVGGKLLLRMTSRFSMCVIEWEMVYRLAGDDFCLGHTVSPLHKNKFHPKSMSVGPTKLA